MTSNSSNKESSDLIKKLHREISNIYTKEGNIVLIGMDREGWIKGKVVIKRVYYVYEDEFSEGIFFLNSMQLIIMMHYCIISDAVSFGLSGQCGLIDIQRDCGSSLASVYLQGP